MSSELDDFLNQQQQQKKKKEEAAMKMYAESEQKINTFINAFRECMDNLIHPTMIAHLENIRQHGYDASVHDFAMKNNYHHQSFYVGMKPPGSRYYIISVLGNHDLQKVCVDIEYFTGTQHIGEPQSLNKTQQQYDIAEITPALLESFVLHTVQQLASEKP